jgi:pSer/pThr/pTyr-binding forkhead associated (FHA) protein
MATLRIDTARQGVSTVSLEYSEEGRLLALPQDKNISLKLLEGNEAGTVFAVAKPRLTIGRANADIIINDRVVSRLHCAIEISNDAVVLRDLGSTNGTIVGNQLVRTATLTSGSTFRIGMHVFQLLITPKEQ